MFFTNFLTDGIVDNQLKLRVMKLSQRLLVRSKNLSSLLNVSISLYMNFYICMYK